MTEVDRKTARAAYVAGETVIMHDENHIDGDMYVLSCKKEIKESSKIRKFNKTVKEIMDSSGISSFFIGGKMWNSLQG